MSSLITVIHVIVCIVLILAVLLQSGKAADLAGAFGGGGSQTVFGPRGAASILSRVTTIGAVLFMVTSIALYILSEDSDKSVVKGTKAPAKTTPAAVTETEKKAKDETTLPAEKKQAEKKTDQQSNTQTEEKKSPDKK